jgi:hypothetical protein
VKSSPERRKNCKNYGLTWTSKQKNSPNLADLRKRFGHVLPVELPENKFHRISPGRVRKVYRASPVKECLVLCPPLLHFEKKPRPPEEINALRDNRTPEQLLDEVEAKLILKKTAR